MNKTFIILITCLLHSNIHYCQGWQKLFGGTDTDIGYSVIQTNDFGYLITGTQYYGTGTNYPGSFIYIIKTDSQGNLLWEKTCGDSGYFYGLSLDTTADNNFVVYTSNNAVTKMSMNGDTLWTYNYNGPYQFYPGGNIIHISASQYIFCGLVTDGILLIKLDSQGDTILTKIISTPYDEGYTVIHSTNDGGYVLSSDWAGYGISIIKLDSSLDTIWTKPYTGIWSNSTHVFSPAGDNKFILTGSDDSLKPFIIKMDSAGNQIWMKYYGNLAPDSIFNDYEGFSISELNGEYLVTGRCTLGVSVYVYFLKTDTDGNLLCERYFGPFGGFSSGNFLNKTFDGGSVIVGSSLAPPFSASASYDIYLIKIDSSCNDSMLSIREKGDSYINFNTYNNWLLKFQNYNQHDKMQIELYNLSGKKIWQQYFSFGNNFFDNVLPSNILPGIYFIMLYQENSVINVSKIFIY